MSAIIFKICFWVFLLATAIQLLAWWGIFARLAFRVTRPKRMAATKLPVSVLICARNEVANLRQNLPAILEQQHPEFEVLVIDDDSSDDSLLMLQPLQQQYPQLRVLALGPKTSPGKKLALAQGIEAARYENLVFTDADCRPASPFWLRHIATGFLPNNEISDPEIVLGYGPYLAQPGLLNLWVRFETVQTAMQYFSFALLGQPYMGVGRNLAWHKRLFARVGGFSAHAGLASGDDDLFVNAAAHAGNTNLCLEPEAFMYSTAKKTWKAWWLQKQRHLSSGRKYRLRHQVLLGTLALSHFLHYFLLAPLLFTDFGTISVIIYTVRMASAFLIYRKILRQLREEYLIVWFILFDALLAVYFAVFLPRILIYSERLISWK